MSDVRAGRSAQPVIFNALSIAFTIFIVVYILIPILVTVVMSFHEAAMIRFPINSWATKWYQDFWNSQQWTYALKNSIFIAVGTTLISAPAGILAAWAFDRYQFPFKNAWYLIIMMPLLPDRL